MTQPQAVAAETCDQFLRQGREFLAQGDLASASSAGWRAAVEAMAAYAGPNADFTDAARELVKDYGDVNAAEWVVSALALSDNVRYDWLDVDGIGRRLDDVQRLAMLVKDIAEPPQSADDVLRRAWECLEGGALIPACEKGWEAATHAAKVYAEAMGYQHIRSNYLSQVTRCLRNERDGKDVGNWAMSARMLLDCSAAKPAVLNRELISDDLEGVSKLVALVEELIADDTDGVRLQNV